MNNNSKIILGIIAAAAAGVAIGLLLAPEKGSDLRKKLLGNANDLGKTFSDLIASGKEKVSELGSDVKQLKHDAQVTAQHTKKIIS